MSALKGWEIVGAIEQFREVSNRSLIILKVKLIKSKGSMFRDLKFNTKTLQHTLLSTIMYLYFSNIAPSNDVTNNEQKIKWSFMKLFFNIVVVSKG